MIATLILAGILAGLVQYFVDFKKLPLYQPSNTGQNQYGFEAFEKPTWLRKIYDFLKSHWQFWGYLTIGIIGALLVPLLSEFTHNSLAGLKEIKEYSACISIKTPQECLTMKPGNWYYLVLLGYGIITGYSAVRIIRGIGSFFIDPISLKQQEQDTKLREAQNELSALKKRFEAIQSDTTKTITPNTNDDEDAATESQGIVGFTGCIENVNPKPWRDWRPAESLKTLLKQVNSLAPYRKKDSDGMIGDEAHQSRVSDHNPKVWDNATNKGIVTALDITHDINGNCNCQKIADSLKANRDSRIKYVIWNKQIMNSSPINGIDAWTWRPYSGSNPHSKHIHISVKCEKENYDSISSWKINVI